MGGKLPCRFCPHAQGAAGSALGRTRCPALSSSPWALLHNRLGIILIATLTFLSSLKLQSWFYFPDDGNLIVRFYFSFTVHEMEQ